MIGEVDVLAFCTPMPTQIPNSTEEDQWALEKCGLLHFSGNSQQIACHAISVLAEG